MFFRNLTLFRFSKSAARELEGLDAAVAERPLRPCGPIETQTLGWVSPFGRGEEALLHQVGDFAWLTLGSEQKLLPPAVVNEELADRLDALEAQRGRRPSGRERKRLKDEVIHELLPRAFVRTQRLSGYLDRKRGWAVIDSASRKAAEGFLTVLRESLESFPALPPDPEESPKGLMTGWLTGAKLPQGFELGDECELKDPADRGAIVRCRRQELTAHEVREHLKSGKQVTQLGLVVEDRVSFVLGEDLALRKLRFLDGVVDELESGDRDSVRAELDARFALMTLTLEPVLEQLAEIFGVPRPQDRKGRA
jgi:recombination associated protein RdgC